MRHHNITNNITYNILLSLNIILLFFIYSWAIGEKGAMITCFAILGVIYILTDKLYIALIFH